MGETRRQHTREFKLEAVRLVEESGRPRAPESKYLSGRRQYAPRKPSVQSAGTGIGYTSTGPIVS
jgi:hypothetical protein